MKKIHLSHKQQLKSISIALTLALLLPLSAPLFQARAANLSESLMRLDRMTTSVTDNDILVVFKTGTTATETAIRLDFATGYVVDTTASNITLTITDIPANIQGEALTACPGVAASDAADVVSGQLVTVNITDLAANTLYGFFITAGIDNPVSVGQYINTLTLEQGTTDDTSKVATRILDVTPDEDQVVITGTVPPLFSFSLGANSTNFTADLDPASVVSSTGVTVNIGTNAANGWVTWLKSANQGLLSATTTQEIVTSGTIDDATTTITAADTNEYYQLDVEPTTDGAGTGTINVDDEYDGDGTHGGTFSATYEEIAISTGTTAGDVLTLIARAVPSAIRAAATDYTDTWTVVGAANF